MFNFEGRGKIREGRWGLRVDVLVKVFAYFIKGFGILELYFNPIFERIREGT